jgi:hypothetical protein
MKPLESHPVLIIKPYRMAFKWFDYERTGWLSNSLIMSVPDGFQMV